MSFYRLWSGKVIEGNENIAKYFEMDMDYLLNVSEDMGYDISHLEELRKVSVEKIRNGETDSISKEAEKLSKHK